jgi:hypothetical protein
MLAFLRKTIERSDEAITPEERLLERRLVESILRKEKEEREKDTTIKKKGKKGAKDSKGKKKGKGPAPTPNSTLVSKPSFDRQESTGEGDEEAELQRMSSGGELRTLLSGDEGIALCPSMESDAAGTAPPLSTQASPKLAVKPPAANSKGTPDILTAMQDKAIRARSGLLGGPGTTSNLGVPGEISVTPSLDEESMETGEEEEASEFGLKEDVSLSSSQRELSVHSGTSLADDLPPLVLRRYFGKPGRESFFTRYHWLAQQYRKLNLPGQEAEFVFENIDDPTEELFFSRGDADIEEELGNVSSMMIAEFESKFENSARRHGEHSDSEDTEVSQLEDPLRFPAAIARKDSRQFSFDSDTDNWPNTPTKGPGTDGNTNTNTSNSNSKTPMPTFGARLPSLQSFSETGPELGPAEDGQASPPPPEPAQEADGSNSPNSRVSALDSEKHIASANRYSMHGKSRSNFGAMSSRTMTMSMSMALPSVSPIASRTMSLPGDGPFKHKKLDSWGLSFQEPEPEERLDAQMSKQLSMSMSIGTSAGVGIVSKQLSSVSLPPMEASLSLSRIHEPSSPVAAKEKLPTLATKRSSVLDLHGSSFSLGTTTSLKKQIGEADFFSSQFIGDCNGIQAPESPRSRYIMGCLSKGLTPKASLIVRKMLSRTMDLQHKGIGDEMAAVLAASLRSMPCLESINLEDNNLSDDGMGPILQALAQVESLRDLNLSNNEIGGVAAEELGNYLVRPDCPLQVLTLHHADVDDFEGERFVNALASNTSLTEVDLSFNKIGSAENLNTVYPDLVTATEAMAELLAQPTCPLRKLKLKWNMMRLDSAVQFAQALAVNESLTYLDVSFNAFGNDAGCAMGDALLDNKTIRTLLISNNGIDSKACFTICIGIQENLGLTKCNMDGNPIGEAGAKALMVLPSVVGTRVNVSANNCNTSIRDPTFWFDQNYPCAEYELHLSDPFERAVCYMLLGLVACHQTLIMTRVFFETSERGQKKTQKLDLVQETFTDKCKYLDESQLAILENLYSLQAAANNTEEAVALFHKYDADESGALDKGELKLVLADFGMMVDDDKIDDFINTYDVDGEGLIEMPEFLSFVKSQYHEAANRIRDMTENMGMALAATPECKFNPAREGVLRFEVIDSFIKKAKYQVISSSDGANLTDVAKKTGDVAKLLSYGFQNSKIRLSEALDLFTTMLGEGGEKFKTIAKLLPQIESTDEARLFIARVTKNNRVEQSRVKIAMGNALWPIIGLPNGFYMLDLGRDTDRICLSRLLELSNTSRFRNMAASKLGHGKIYIYYRYI